MFTTSTIEVCILRVTMKLKVMTTLQFLLKPEQIAAGLAA